MPVCPTVILLPPEPPSREESPRYSVTLLIPKTDTATKADIDSAIQAAANEALSKVWNGVRPPVLKVPVYDGDGVRPSGVPFGDECKGHWVLNASTKNKPQVVGIDNINCERPRPIFTAACTAAPPSVSSDTRIQGTRVWVAGLGMC